MIALSVKQPHATNIILGKKIYEFRNWKIKQRGTILICSSSSRPSTACDYPRGVAIGLVDVVDVVPVDSIPKKYRPVNDYKWAFVLENPREVENIPIKGAIMPFELKAEQLLRLSISDCQPT